MKILAKTGAAIAAVAAFTAICGFGLACDKAVAYDGRLSVRILAQPQGGLYVNTVSSVVEVTVLKDDALVGDILTQPITLESRWKSPSGTYNDSTKDYEVVGMVDTLWLSKSAPSGMYLDKNFWLLLTWDDSAGAGSLTSDTAACRVN